MHAQQKKNSLKSFFNHVITHHRNKSWSSILSDPINLPLTLLDYTKKIRTYMIICERERKKWEREAAHNLDLLSSLTSHQLQKKSRESKSKKTWLLPEYMKKKKHKQAPTQSRDFVAVQWPVVHLSEMRSGHSSGLEILFVPS